MLSRTKTSVKKTVTAMQYVDQLQPAAKERYFDKIQIIGGQDPYQLSNMSEDEKNLPAVTYADIVNYLLFSPSPYTAEDLKSYKGLEAYNQMCCGWIRERKCTTFGDKCLVKGKVLHSQRVREKPLEPWFIAESNGRVLAGHCTCMAGLGETCTHVATLLFSVEASVRLRESKTVTQEKAYWLLPGGLKGIDYKQCKDIDFSSAKMLKKKMDSGIENNVHKKTDSVPRTLSRKETPEPSSSEFNSFLSALHETGSKCAIFAITPQFADEYIPKPLTDNFPPILTELRDESTFGLNHAELVAHCKSIKLTVTKEQSEMVEKSTRDQSRSKLWYHFRAGRITASKMKPVCCTDPAHPAPSLIKSVCYPETTKIISQATEWGCSHEKLAREMFLERINQSHTNANIFDTGLFISPEVPYIGASPDGFLVCDCCGVSVVEIKCPFCKRHQNLNTGDKHFYLQKDSSGTLKLIQKHPYYYQVQTQMGVCNIDSAYFVVWTEKDLHYELIAFNAEFWADVTAKANHIFTTAILPELVGKYYTRLPSLGKFNKTKIPQTTTPTTAKEPNVVHSAEIEETWCYCGQVESGKMIACDNSSCPYQWFHCKCLGITSTPKGKWFCPDCKKTTKPSSKKKQGV